MLLQSYHSAWYSNMQLCKMISGFSTFISYVSLPLFMLYHVTMLQYKICASVIIVLLFEVDSRWLTRVVC